MIRSDSKFTLALQVAAMVWTDSDLNLESPIARTTQLATMLSPIIRAFTKLILFLFSISLSSKKLIPVATSFLCIYEKPPFATSYPSIIHQAQYSSNFSPSEDAEDGCTSQLKDVYSLPDHLTGSLVQVSTSSSLQMFPEY